MHLDDAGAELQRHGWQFKSYCIWNVHLIEIDLLCTSSIDQGHFVIWGSNKKMDHFTKISLLCIESLARGQADIFIGLRKEHLQF